MSWQPSGYVPQSTQEIIADINAQFVAVFGSGFNTSPSSVNGQWVQQLANNAIYNQNQYSIIFQGYNPNTAQGVFLDSICALTGIYRQQATNSHATCQCLGSANTVIPAGTQIQSTNGDVFASKTSAVIGANGEVDIIFYAVNAGAVSVGANTLTNIINRVYGWDSVNNESAGVVGLTTQTDNSLRKTRNQYISFVGSASLLAIANNVSQATGVTAVYAIENNLSASQVINGVTLNPNSIYIAAIGGDNNDIARAIYNKKSPGSAYTGNTTVNYIDSWNNTNPITFQRPIQTPVKVTINVYNSSTYPPNFNTVIQQVIVNNFNGVDTNNPNISAVGIYEMINVYNRFMPTLISVGANISSMAIQLASGGAVATEIQLPANQIATLITTNVVVNLI